MKLQYINRSVLFVRAVSFAQLYPISVNKITDMEKMIIAVLLICCGSAFARTAYESNQYMDTVLYTHFPNEGRHFNVDPAKIANFSIEVKDKMFGSLKKVNMNYYNGQMTGMFKVRRAGNCSPVRRDRGNVTLNCTLVLNDIRIHYQARMKYSLRDRVVTAVANMSSTNVFVEVTTNQTRNFPSLRRIQLTRTGNFKVTISNIDIIGRNLADSIRQSFASRVSTEFFNVFNYNFVPSFRRAVTRAPMPHL